MNTPKQAIVFSGGGAYGAYEVGVLKALAKTSWAGPQIVSGASAGAFNAALLAGAPEGDLPGAARLLEDVWVNYIPGNVMRVVADPMTLLGSLGSPFQATLNWLGDVQTLSTGFLTRLLNVGPVGPFDDRWLQLVDLASLVSVSPLEKLLGSLVKPERLRESKMKLSIVATNWATGQAEVFNNEKMTDANTVGILLASAAIPGLFPPRNLGTGTYVDGGVVTNTPLSSAIKDGADEIRIIYLDHDVSKAPLLKVPNTFDTLDRVLAISQTFRVNSDIENARRINRAIEMFDERSKESAEMDTSELAHLASLWERRRSERRRRKLTIHKYFPGRDLGGVLGMLRFEKHAHQRLIERGYDDTMKHDCGINRCVCHAASTPS